MSSYRDDLEAAQARADALARENEQLRSEKAALEGASPVVAPQHAPRPAPPDPYVPVYDGPPPWAWWRKVGLVVGIVLAVATVVLAVLESRAPGDEEPYVMWLMATTLGSVLGFWVAAGAPAPAGD